MVAADTSVEAARRRAVGAHVGPHVGAHMGVLVVVVVMVAMVVGKVSEQRRMSLIEKYITAKRTSQLVAHTHTRTHAHARTHTRTHITPLTISIHNYPIRRERYS